MAVGAVTLVVESEICVCFISDHQSCYSLCKGSDQTELILKMIFFHEYILTHTHTVFCAVLLASVAAQYT